MTHSTPERRAIVLLSGGLDSTTCLALALAERHEVTALSFDYAQRHSHELAAARRVAAHYGLRRHLVCRLDFLRELGGSALTDPRLAVPRPASVEEIGRDIPVTYVPARNLVFLAHAAAAADVAGAQAIYIGVNALDYSGYPDCRPAFIDAFARAATLGTRRGAEGLPLTIVAPLQRMTKAEIVRAGVELGVPHHLTHSCYDPRADGRACGRCDSCLLRRKGFAEADLADPIAYADA